MKCKSCGHESENGVHSCEGFKLQQANVMDKQVGGDHYKKQTIQPWDIIDEYELDFYEGNALKYLLRDKSGTIGNTRKEDLEKAKHYIEKKLTQWDENPKQSRIKFEEDDGDID